MGLGHLKSSLVQELYSALVLMSPHLMWTVHTVPQTDLKIEWCSFSNMCDYQQIGREDVRNVLGDWSWHLHCCICGRPSCRPGITLISEAWEWTATQHCIHTLTSSHSSMWIQLYYKLNIFSVCSLSSISQRRFSEEEYKIDTKMLKINPLSEG